MYKCRIDSNTTVTYDGKSVIICHSDNYWGREESCSVSISNIDVLIEALQDIRKEKSNEW